jgi:hypothetical protein
MSLLVIIDDEADRRQRWLKEAVHHFFPFTWPLQEDICFYRMPKAASLLKLNPTAICWDNDLGYPIGDGEMAETSRFLSRWLREMYADDLSLLLRNAVHLIHSANPVKAPEIRNLLLDFGVSDNSIVVQSITQESPW